MKTLPSSAYWGFEPVCAALVADQAVAAGQAVVTGVHQHEAARAVGVLCQSGTEKQA
jgi:hypothetical protein